MRPGSWHRRRLLRHMEILERTLAYEAYTFLRQQHPFHSTIWLHDGFSPPPPPALVTTMPIRTIPFYFILTDLHILSRPSIQAKPLDGKATENLTGLFQTNCFAPVSLEALDISDHVGATTKHTKMPRPITRGRLKQQPEWAQPSFLNPAQWEQMVGQAWLGCQQEEEYLHLRQLPPSEIHVDDEWKDFMSLLSKVFH